MTLKDRLSNIGQARLTRLGVAPATPPEPPKTIEEGQRMLADRQIFDRYQAAKSKNPFAAARFRAENAEAIERGSKVPAPPPPDDPPPQPPPAAA